MRNATALLADERSRNDISSPTAPAASATAEPGVPSTASPGPGIVDVLNTGGRLLRDDNVGPL